MRHKHCVIWNLSRNTEKSRIMRNGHSRTWNMAKKKKKPLKNVENEKCTLQDLEYGKKNEKREKV